VGTLELMDEVRGLQAVVLSEVAEGERMRTGFNNRWPNALFGGSVDGGDYGFRCEAVEEMEEWGEAELGVEGAIAGQLVEDIFNHQAEGVFCLHELKAGGAGLGSGQLGALLGATNIRCRIRRGRRAGELLARRSLGSQSR